MDEINQRSISFVISSLRGGGAERICVTLANGFSKSGWLVEVVVLNLEGATLQEELLETINLVNLDIRHARSSFLKLERYIRVNNPSKVFVFNHQVALMMLLVRKVLSKKYLVVSRNISTLSEKKAAESSLWHKYIVHGLVKVFFKNVDRIVAQSNGMKDDLLNNYGFKEKQISMINNPINPVIEQQIAGGLGNMGCSGDSEYLLCVGRLNAVKAFHFAIEAFLSISKKYPLLRLKIVGTGSEEEKLKLLAKQYGIEDLVDFEGFQKDLIPFYLGAKATVLTSLYEGFPNVLVESIALGTPIVAFNCKSGPKEIVSEGINGYLVRYQDKSHLVECLEKVIECDLGRESILETAERFSSKLILQEYMETVSSA